MLGALTATIAVVFFSINDVAIKFLSDGYALHQVVLFRSLIGLSFLMAFVAPFAGGMRVLHTKRLAMHMVRGACVVFANMTFFLGLAAMPLAEAVAIFFISPLVITVFSVVFLGEQVGPRRWVAVGVGLVGVVVVLRPGTQAFQLASMLPLAAAFGYAALHMLTRKIGTTESAATMSIYIQLMFVLVSLTMGLLFGTGQFAAQSDPSLAFLFRAWIWPAPSDYAILITLGAASAIGGFCISQAYRSSEAALVAPFEYLAMPLSILWGILVFGEWPDLMSYLGITLILGSGLYMIWREWRLGRAQLDTPKARR
ncbi:MAG: DMT family transporter [Octadecabacter sp.]|nr:DMT family transporter [Octadecabacter sp.]